MDDVRVRRAINYAVDKDAFLATVYKGIALKAGRAPDRRSCSTTPRCARPIPFDAAKAKALLGEAGWQPGADGIRHEGRPAARDRPERHRVRRRRRSDGAAHPGLAARGRDRRQDQGAGAAAVVRGQLPLRHPRAGDVPPRHRSRRAVLAVPLLAGRPATSTGRACKSAKADSSSSRVGASPTRPSAARSTSRSSSSLLDEALSVPLVDELAVWAYRPSVQGTKYNFNAYPVLSDAHIVRR